MTTAVPNKTPKAKRQPVCRHCKQRFRTVSATAIYCTRQCKQLSAAIKKRVNYTTKAADSAFMDLLARECIRARTIQVLQGHDVASLTDLYDLYKRHLCANEYGATHEYALSHIHPVARHNSIGLFHASNLVIAPSLWNRQHGTKHFGHGLSISRSQLKSCNEVTKGASRKETIARIIRFLGEDTITEFAKAVKLQPTQRYKTLAWLYDHLDPSIPEHADHLGKLEAMSSKALSTLKAKLQGKESSGFKLIVREVTLFTIMAQELTRFATIRPDLAPLAGFVQECSVRINHRESVITQSTLLPLLFALLHGKEFSAVADELVPTLQQLKSLGKITAPIPDLGQSAKPSKHHPSLVASLAKPSVMVLKTFRSFAADLDESTPETIPMLRQGHTAKYEADPLPWD